MSQSLPMDDNMPRSSSHIPALDGLRAVAALMVVVHHYWPRIAPFGWIGVDLFFVLSGFLITRIILTNGHQRGFLRNFYARRTLRIWPIYYLTFVALLVVCPFLYEREPTEGWIYQALYLQGAPHYWSGYVPPFTHWFAHSWTLAIEEQFYIFWPFLILLIGAKWVPAASLLLILIAVFARSIGLPESLTFSRVDGLAMGALLAAALSSKWCTQLGAAKLRSLFGMCAILVGAYLGWIMIGGGTRSIAEWPVWRSLTFTAIAAFFFSLTGWIMCSPGSAILRPLSYRSIAYLGRISYGIYLYHMIVMMLIVEIALWCNVEVIWWHKLVGLGGTLAVAAVSWVYIEAPILRLKVYFEYRNRSDAGPCGDSNVAAETSPIPSL